MIDWQRYRLRKPLAGSKIIVMLDNGEIHLSVPETSIPIYAWANLVGDDCHVKWVFSAPPLHRPCLTATEDGRVMFGKPEFGSKLIGWSLINNPAWLKPRLVRGYASGEDHPKARLTDAQCQEMDKLYSTGDFSYYQLATQFGCSKSTVRDIVKGRRRCASF